MKNLRILSNGLECQITSSSEKDVFQKQILQVDKMFVKRVEECRYMRLLVLFKWVKKLYSVYEALEYKKEGDGK